MSKKVLKGCGVACCIIIVVIVICFIVFYPKVLQWLERESEKAKTIEEFASQWEPPSDHIGIEQSFPAKVGQFELSGKDKAAGIPEFNIDFAGHHATYKKDREEIEIYVYRATQLEKEALYHRVAESIQHGDYSSWKTYGSPRSDRYKYSVSRPKQKGFLWWTKGWLFYFKTTEDFDLDKFVILYLDTIQEKK